MKPTNSWAKRTLTVAIAGAALLLQAGVAGAGISAQGTGWSKAEAQQSFQDTVTSWCAERGGLKDYHIDTTTPFARRWTATGTYECNWQRVATWDMTLSPGLDSS